MDRIHMSFIESLGMYAAIAIVSAASHAQSCDPQWLPSEEIPGFQSLIRATTVWDPDGVGPLKERLVMAADNAAPAGDLQVNGIVAWDGIEWHSLGGGVTSADALCVHDGDLIAGGSFTIAGGNPANRIARWDGTTWNPIGSGGMNGPVYCVATHYGELIAGGRFTMAGGNSVMNIARWDGSNWMPLAGGLGSPSTNVRSIISHDGQLYACGTFSFWNGSETLRHVARWDGTAWFALAGGVDNAANTLVVYQGDLVVGGHFDNAPGIPNTEGVARWDGTSWSSIGGGLPNDGPVHSASVHDGDLIVGGDLSTTGFVRRWNGESWQTLGSGMVGIWGTIGVVLCVQEYAGQLIAAGGFFTADGNSALSVARWDGNSWLPLNDAMPDLAQILTSDGHDVYSAGGESVSRWDGQTWTRIGQTNWYIFALAIHNGDLVAAGTFGTINGVSVYQVARWDGNTWHPYPDAFDYSVRALVVYNGQLIAGGDFTGSVVRWDGSAWQPMAGLTGPVYTLTVHNGILIAGGAFAPPLCLARWNGLGWQQVGGASVTGPNAYVSDLITYNNDLIVAGSFNAVGGISTANIARWNGTQWFAMGHGVETEPKAIEVYNGSLFVGGSFLNASGIAVNRIARWDGLNWSALGEGLSSTVEALLSYQGELLVGRQSLARWTDTNIPWISLQPQNANATCIGVATLTVTPASGYSNLSYQWRKDGEPLADGMTKDGSTISGALTASLTITDAQGADAGDYDVIVSNDCGEAVSDLAVLIVNHCGDLTGDGLVGVPDLLEVINAWGPCPALPQTCPADVAPPPYGDGIVGTPDLLLVINNWG